MLKKVISLMIVILMLVPFSSAVAADLPSAQPTIEEILNGYHQKAFEAQSTQEAASAWSRRSTGSSKTLEQETVDQLTEAGYEAYNITAENYDTLETTLQTDFNELGMQLDESYIVVVSGEDDATVNSSRVSDLVLPPHTENEGAPSSFYYEQNGIVYEMRYLTITSADANDRNVFGAYVINPDQFNHAEYTILETSLVTLSDTLTGIPIATFVSLLADLYNDPNSFESSSGLVTLNAATTWTCNIIQIWNENRQRWETAQSSEYAISKAYISGYVLDEMSEEPVRYVGPEYTHIDYSSNYHNLTTRKTNAVNAYEHYTVSANIVSSVKFYLGSTDGEVIFSSIDEPLIENTRSSEFLYPLYSDP